MIRIEQQISAVKNAIRDLSHEVAKTQDDETKADLSLRIAALQSAVETLTLIKQQQAITQQLQAVCSN
jgi:stress-induced morphogen